MFISELKEVQGENQGGHLKLKATAVFNSLLVLEGVEVNSAVCS